MEDGTAADPHSGTGAAASAAERCGAPVPGSRSKAAALLGAFKTRGDCNSSPPPTPPTPTQTPDPCSSPFLPINFGDTLMVATPPPDEVSHPHHHSISLKFTNGTTNCNLYSSYGG